MDFVISERLRQLPPYLFVELDKKKAEAISRGVDVIDLGIGDPDLPTPDFVIEKMIEAIKNPDNHRYPSSMGSKKFRTSAAMWCKKRFGLDFDPETQVATLIGSKEGIAHFPLAFLNPGDVALVPTPGYPVYHIGTLFCNARTYFLPLLAKNNFLPDLDSIPDDILKKARILWLNYPNNPTAAIAPDEFYKKAIEFAHKHNIIICHDAAYSEITYDGYVAKSFFEFDGAIDVGIEFHSHSKTYNMTGWRIGFAVGAKELVAGLKQAKSNLDSGQFNAIQEAGMAALESDGSFVNEMKSIYAKRRDVFVSGLRDIGLNAPFPKATFYVWCPVPDNFTSESFAAFAIEKAGIVCAPGNGFGAPGEGYVRFSLTVSEERLKEAVHRLKKAI